MVRINAKLQIDDNTLKYTNIEYHLQADEIKKDSLHVEIPQIDKQIFLLFLKNIDKIVNKNSIFELMEKPTDVALRVHISKIKKLLGVNITNIRGQGYKLEEV